MTNVFMDLGELVNQLKHHCPINESSLLFLKPNQALVDFSWHEL